MAVLNSLLTPLLWNLLCGPKHCVLRLASESSDVWGNTAEYLEFFEISLCQQLLIYSLMCFII